MSLNNNKIVKLSLVLLAAVGAPVEGAITWNVSYEDINNSTGVGFDDPVLTLDRRATVVAALDYINTIVDENGVADIEFSESGGLPAGLLATSNSIFTAGPAGFQDTALFRHATTGVDPLPGFSDAILTVNFDGTNTINSELDDPTIFELDLFSLVLHEVTHTMGFTSLIDPASGDSIATSSDPGIYTTYDSLLERGDGTPLFAAGGDFIGIQSDLTSDDLFFNGTTSGQIQVLATLPGVFGFDISHLDPSVPGVMGAIFTPGVKEREYSEADIAVLRDIGWTIVPEPGTYALLMLMLVTSATKKREANKQN